MKEHDGLAVTIITAGAALAISTSPRWMRIFGQHNSPPGKIVLTRGLRRLMDRLITRTYLDYCREEHGALPPRIAEWKGEPPPDDP